MTERPRPQYGEYASPEDQAKAMGLPPAPVGKPVTVPPPPVSSASSVVSPSRTPLPPTPLPPAPQPPAPPTAPNADPTRSDFSATGVRPPRRWDLFLSIILIVYGATVVFSGFASGPTLAPQMSEVYSRMGLGTYSATALAGSLGRLVNFVNGILFVITLIVTGTLLRRGHIGFYVPLIAGVITTLFAAVCLVALLTQDPAAMSRFGG